MKKLIALTATSLLILAGCATDSGETEVPTTTTSTSTSSTTTSETPEPEPVPEPAPEPVAVVPAAPAPVYTPPTFSYCVNSLDGQAVMSDGSVIYLDRCEEFGGGPPRLADGRSVYEAFPENYENVDWEADRAWSDCIEAGGTSETCAG